MNHQIECKSTGRSRDERVEYIANEFSEFLPTLGLEPHQLLRRIVMLRGSEGEPPLLEMWWTSYEALKQHQMLAQYLGKKMFSNVLFEHLCDDVRNTAWGDLPASEYKPN